MIPDWLREVRDFMTPWCCRCRKPVDRYWMGQRGCKYVSILAECHGKTEERPFDAAVLCDWIGSPGAHVERIEAFKEKLALPEADRD